MDNSDDDSVFSTLSHSSGSLSLSGIEGNGYFAKGTEDSPVDADVATSGTNLTDLNKELAELLLQKEGKTKAIASLKQKVKQASKTLKDIEKEINDLYTLTKTLRSGESSHENDVRTLLELKQEVATELSECKERLAVIIKNFKEDQKREIYLFNAVESFDEKGALVEKTSAVTPESRPTDNEKDDQRPADGEIEEPSSSFNPGRIAVVNATNGVKTPDQVETSSDIAQRGILMRDEIVGESYWASMYRCRRIKDDHELVAKVIDLEQLDNHCIEHLQSNTYKIMWLLYETGPQTIVAVYDWFLKGRNQFFIIEEKLERSFEVIITENGPFEESDVKVHARDLADALYFLFSSGIAHQNIGAQNVYFSSSKALKLSAMEYATIYWNPDTDSPYLQQVVYDVKNGKHVAPETASKQPYDPGKADVYSYGTFIFYMATGFYPYDYEKPGAVDEQWETNKAKYDNKISELGRDLAQKCLMVNPAERITTLEILRHPWFSELQHN